MAKPKKDKPKKDKSKKDRSKNTKQKKNANKKEKKVLGAFRNKHNRSNVAKSIEFEDLINPYNFYNLMQDEDLNDWMRDKRLLSKGRMCEKCDGWGSPKKRARNISGETFRCKKNNNHEFGIRKYSFFDNAKYSTQDILAYILELLLGSTMKRAAYVCGITYGKTSVDYNKSIREIFMQYVSNIQYTTKFSGTIEIDESLFGRKVKDHRGGDRNPKVWVFGKSFLIHRSGQ